MEPSYFFLIGLGILSGFSVSCLGMGGGVYIVPLIPLLIGLSHYETMQLSFLIIFCFASINAVLFAIAGRIDWKFVKMVVLISSPIAFVSNFFVLNLSPYQVRLVLGGFLGLIMILPFLLKKSVWIVKRLPGISGVFVGFCTGLTGIGGGTILSPILHESKLISIEKIAGTICMSMAPIAGFGLLAQIIGTDFPKDISPVWWQTFFILISSSLFGSIIGYNIKFKSRTLPRYIVRILVSLIFSKVAWELIANF